jgi:hypothetical protein
MSGSGSGTYVPPAQIPTLSTPLIATTSAFYSNRPAYPLDKAYVHTASTTKFVLRNEDPVAVNFTQYANGAAYGATTTVDFALSLKLAGLEASGAAAMTLYDPNGAWVPQGQLVFEGDDILESEGCRAPLYHPELSQCTWSGVLSRVSLPGGTTMPGPLGTYTLIVTYGTGLQKTYRAFKFTLTERSAL